MPAEITLEIKIFGNDEDLNMCHQSCNYLEEMQAHGSALCKLFRKIGYLKRRESGFKMFHVRCQPCIDAQREVKTWKVPEMTETEKALDAQNKTIVELGEALARIQHSTGACEQIRKDQEIEK